MYVVYRKFDEEPQALNIDYRQKRGFFKELCADSEFEHSKN